MSRNGKHPEPRERKLTRAEIVGAIEAGAQRRRGLSARRLVSAFNRGKLEDPGEMADLLGLAGLLREDDPLFVAP